MREIKFRQWHNGVFYHWGFIDGRFDGVTTGGGISIKEAQKHSQQYTGLHDCKGKEIYEGDILHFTIYNANGVIEWDDRYYSYQVHLLARPPEKRQNGSLFDFVTSVGWCDSYEVIGNIYENPELLEVK